MWFIFALLSAFFAALTSILAKIGIQEVNSNLATAIRTVVAVSYTHLQGVLKGTLHARRFVNNYGSRRHCNRRGRTLKRVVIHIFCTELSTKNLVFPLKKYFFQQWLNAIIPTVPMIKL